MLDELCCNTKMFIGLLYPYNFTRDNVKMMCCYIKWLYPP